MNYKLTKEEELTIRLLESNIVSSKQIPIEIFGEKEKAKLQDLNLIQIKDNEWILTQKAVDLIEEGGFIIKYPLHDGKGNVLNYNDVLNTMSKNAARALGRAIIETMAYTKFGKSINLSLLSELKESKQYYRSKQHPISKIKGVQEDLNEAQSDYERVLDIELSKIKEYDLFNPIKFGIIDGYKTELVKLINSDRGLFKITILNKEEEHDLKGVYKLSNYYKFQIITQYWRSKSSR